MADIASGCHGDEGRGLPTKISVDIRLFETAVRGEMPQPPHFCFGETYLRTHN